MTRRADVAVIGGGIVGLAVADALVREHPRRSVVVVEKEHRLAAHQTGRNSGVLHSGIYYRPGSLKARTVAAGRTAMLALCEAEGVAHEICGKVIVATDERERHGLYELAGRGRANGVELAIIDRSCLAALEPHVNGVEALHVPGAGIVDFVAVCDVLARRIRTAGGEILLGRRVSAVDERPDSVVLRGADADDIEARWLVNCGGLHADELAGRPPDLRIVAFRGEYYDLVPAARGLVRNLVYPVPDPSLPFLGVHLTRMLGGHVHAGPNAVPALSREGYRWRDVDIAEVRSLLRFPGIRPLARRYWRTELTELRRSLSKAAFVRSVQRLVPDVQAHQLRRSPAGVRAQALDGDGRLLDDFALRETARAVHVLNAPSPAATASLEIGRVVAERLAARF